MIMRKRSLTPSTSRQRYRSISSKFSTVRNESKITDKFPIFELKQIGSKIQQIKQKSYSPYLTLIRKSIQNIQQAESDQIKLKEKSNLSKILNAYHEVFSKIDYTICLKIVLNSFFRKYDKNQKIPLNNLSIGFLIYGKLLIKNDITRFQTILKDQQVINQQLIVDQKYGIPTTTNPKMYVLYDAIAIGQCMILWLQCSKIQQIRLKCFTDFGLKNALRVFMIKKKLKVDKAKQF